MSNSTKAVIAIVSIIIVISGIFVLTKSRPVENSTSFSSSVSVVTSSSKAVLSSSSLVVSSSSQIVSKSIEGLISSKTEQSTSANSQVAQVPTCNQPDSPDLVKTEDGCFKLNISGLNSDDKKLNNIIKLISKDYFYKIKNIAKNSNVAINVIYRPFSKDFPLYLFSNIQNISDKNPNIPMLSLFNAFYTFENEDFKFLFFELRGDGKTQNINDVLNEYKEYLKI